MKRINDNNNNKNNKPLKYSTISGGTTKNLITTTKNKRNSVLGNLFSSNSTYSNRNSMIAGDKEGEIERNDEEMKDLNEINDNLLVNNRWNVSITENKDATRKNKINQDRSLILYVSTPTTSLTLIRTYSSLLELDKLLRINVPTLLPARELLQSSQSLNSSFTIPSITTPKKRSTVLETISRTLSPRRSPSSNSINASLKSLSPSSSSTKGKEALDLSALSRYMTELCNEEVVRNQRGFKEFIRVEKDDLISVRNVERRIKKARSAELLAGRPSSLIGGSSNTLLAGDGRKEASDDSMRSQLDENVNSTNQREEEARSIVNSSTAAALRLTLYPPTDSLDSLLSSPNSTRMNRRELSEATTIGGGSSMDTSTHSSSRPQSDVFMEENDNASSNRRSSTLFSSQIEEKQKKGKKEKKNRRKMGIEDFECMRVLGKGCAGKVLLVREKRNGELFALKAIHKTHVLAHRELAHTLTEQSVLRHSSSLSTSSPFIVHLHYSFHDTSTLYLLLDFHPGGDLATQLARWGRLGRDRARFYMSEICTGLKGLHEMGVIYRDLKPENVLISAEGHIVLTDFGLSKDFGHYHSNSTNSTSSSRPHWLNQTDRSISTPTSSWSELRRETTSTFCGTAEYLAPEVLLGEPYSYEVDAWSLGTMLYEMLSGVTPFWSEDHAQMYHKVLHTDLVFESSTLIFDADTKSLLRGLLQKNPLLRMTDQRILKHPYFSMIDWSHVTHKRYVPPYIPTLNLSDPTDLSQFDETFLNMNPGVGEEIEEVGAGEGGKDMTEDIEGGPEEGRDEDGKDVFDGYSFYGQETEESEAGEEEVDDVDVDRDDDDRMVESAVLEETRERTGSELSRPISTSSQGDSNLDHTFTSISPSPTFDTLPTTIHESPSQLNRTPIKPIKSLDTLSETEVLSSPTTQPTIVLDAVTELDVSDDDDWDHFDNVDGDDDTSLASTGVVKVRGESKNGGKATSLWARGVTDRYKLLIVSPRNSSTLTPSSSRPSLLKLGRRASQSNTSSKQPTPSTTPEPTSPQVLQQSNNRKSLRRLASNRSAASSKSHQLNSKKSKTDLMGEDSSTMGGEENFDSKGAKTGLGREGSQRKVAGGIQRLALSAFRSKSP